MARIFKGKLPAGQQEISIVICGDYSARWWDAGCPLHRPQRSLRAKGIANGTPLKIEHVIAADGGRGEIVRKLGELNGILAWGVAR